MPFLAAVVVCRVMLIMSCSVILLMWGFPCSAQAVPWLWCLCHRFLHRLSEITAVPELSKQLILLEWHWLYWRHVQTKIYARRVGNRLFIYSVSADFFVLCSICCNVYSRSACTGSCQLLFTALYHVCFQTVVLLEKASLKNALFPLLPCTLTALSDPSLQLLRSLQRGTFIYFKTFIKGAGFMWQIASFHRLRF